MKLKFTRLIPSIALVCLLFGSCKKDDAVNTNTPSAVSPQQSARVTSMIGAMQYESDMDAADLAAAESVGSITGKGADAGECPVRSASPAAPKYPRTVTFDYGTGCTDMYGRTVSGKKYITLKAYAYTAPAGTVYSVITYSNYYVNGVNISGSVSNKVLTPGTPGGYAFVSTVAKTISDHAGNTSTYIGRVTRTQVVGDINSVMEDKGFSIAETVYGAEVTPGEATVVWQQTADKLSPPIKLGACQFISQGLIHITLASLKAVTHETLNYGNGDCNNDAILNVNGVAQPTKLPFQFFTNHL